MHALAQVVHVDLDGSLLSGRFGAGGPGEELPALARALDALCGAEIAVWRAVVAPAGFDARRSATARRYRYEIEISARADPRRRGRVWRVERPLDLAVMRIATDPFLGEHDFSAFCRRPPGHDDGPLTRTVTDAAWSTPGEGLLRFEIEAAAFCHQMVRSIVGALVCAGEGRTRPSDLVALLRSRSREGAPPVAPPEGLCLVAVRYPEELGGTWS